MIYLNFKHCLEYAMGNVVLNYKEFYGNWIAQIDDGYHGRYHGPLFIFGKYDDLPAKIFNSYSHYHFNFDTNHHCIVDRFCFENFSPRCIKCRAFQELMKDIGKFYLKRKERRSNIISELKTLIKQTTDNKESQNLQKILFFLENVP